MRVLPAVSGSIGTAGVCLTFAVRHETKEAPADARPQAQEKPEAYSLEYVEDFSGPRTTQMPVHRLPQ